MVDRGQFDLYIWISIMCAVSICRMYCMHLQAHGRYFSPFQNARQEAQSVPTIWQAGWQAVQFVCTVSCYKWHAINQLIDAIQFGNKMALAFDENIIRIGYSSRRKWKMARTEAGKIKRLRERLAQMIISIYLRNVLFVMTKFTNDTVTSATFASAAHKKQQYAPNMFDDCYRIHKLTLP